MSLPTMHEAFLKLLSIHRHEFLNYLQVVGGMAQLNKTDKLLEYIRKVTGEIQQLGRLAALGDPRLAVLIYEKLVQDNPTQLNFEVREPLPVLPDSVLLALADVLSELRTLLVNGFFTGVTISALYDKVPALEFVFQPGMDGLEKSRAVADRAGLACLADPEGKKLCFFLDNCTAKEER